MRKTESAASSLVNKGKGHPAKRTYPVQTADATRRTDERIDTATRQVTKNEQNETGQTKTTEPMWATKPNVKLSVLAVGKITSLTF